MQLRKNDVNSYTAKVIKLISDLRSIVWKPLHRRFDNHFKASCQKKQRRGHYATQWRHLNFSYNAHTVWNGYEVPLHPGAARYYKEKGYIK